MLIRQLAPEAVTPQYPVEGIAEPIRSPGGGRGGDGIEHRAGIGGAERAGGAGDEARRWLQLECYANITTICNTTLKTMFSSIWILDLKHILVCSEA